MNVSNTTELHTSMVNLTLHEFYLSRSKNKTIEAIQK